MTSDLRPSFYDVIYSRDTILHIQDKLSLFKRQVAVYCQMLIKSIALPQPQLIVAVAQQRIMVKSRL